MKDHIDTITDLLLGAAYADKRLDGKELETIESLLCKLLGAKTLPQAQQTQIKRFNPAKFDVAASAAVFAGESQNNKRRLVELIASVNEADDEIDFDEDLYLRRVALGVGLSDQEIADLTFELLEDDDLDHFFDGELESEP